MFSSDATAFGGGGVTNGSAIKTQDVPMHGCEQSVSLTLAGLLGVLPGVREEDPQAGPARARQKDGSQNRAPRRNPAAKPKPKVEKKPARGGKKRTGAKAP